MGYVIFFLGTDSDFIKLVFYEWNWGLVYPILRRRNFIEGQLLFKLFGENSVLYPYIV